MLDQFGFEALLGIAVIAVAALVAVALLYRFRWRVGRNPLLQEEIGAAGGTNRLAVLESTEVDAERRLILVRCVDIEHLIMVGGPTDIVIENDVRRRRAAVARPAGRPIAAELVSRPGRAEGEPSAVREAPRAEAPPAAAAQASSAAAERTEPLVARASQQSLASAAPAGRNGPGVEASAEADGQRRPPEGGAAGANPRALLREQRRRARQAARNDETRPEEGEERKQPPSGPAAGPQPAQRDAAAPALRPAAPPAPSPPTSPSPPSAQAADGRLRLQPLIGGRRDSEIGARRDKPGRDEAERPREPPRAEAPPRSDSPTPRAEALPPADTPWSEPDSIENEIVRALRVEPQPPLSPMALPALPASTRGNAAKPTTDPGTTLGDLADRLEEALAREVQAANTRHTRLDLDLGPFGLDREREARDKSPPPAPPAPPKERSEPKLTLPASPEAEPRRELRAAPERTERQERPERQERQEETPVISLNARRREPVDPLEDEMARLLGELTGDSTRR